MEKSTMNRRDFIKSTGLITLGVGLYRFAEAGLHRLFAEGKTHILTLSFDDGFKKSFYRTAEIHEEYGLKACLNVVAMGNTPGYISEKWIKEGLIGNFDDWNKAETPATNMTNKRQRYMAKASLCQEATTRATSLRVFGVCMRLPVSS